MTEPQKTPYNMLIKPEDDSRRYCGACELPQEICACAEAKAYDEASTKPVDKPHNCGYDTSTKIGSVGHCIVLFECNVCGEEWEKDVS